VLIFTFIWRNLTSRPGRTVLLAAALGIAAALVVVLQGMGDRLARLEVESARQEYGCSDLSAKLTGAGDLDLRSLTRIPGVESVVGLLDVQLDARLQLGGARLVLTGVTWNEPLARDMFPLTTGRYAVAQNEILLEEWVARSAGIALNEAIDLDGAGKFRVVGLFADRPGSRQFGRGFAATDIAAARLLDGARRSFSSVAVKVGERGQPRSVAAQLQAWLREAGTVKQNEFLLSARAKAASVRLVFASAGALAVLVAGFILLNAASMSLAERMHRLGILRALGAHRSVLFRLVLAEGAVVGGLSAMVAVPLCLAGLRFTGSTGSPARLAMAAVLCLGVALAAYLLPAGRAVRVSVLHSLSPTRMPGGQDRAGKGRLAAGLGTVVAGLALIVKFGLAASSVPTVVITGLLGCGLLLVGLCCLSTWLVSAIATGLAMPMRLVAGVGGEMAALNLARERSRTASAMSVVMVASTLLMGYYAVVGTRTAAVEQRVLGSVPTDYVLRLPHRGLRPGEEPISFDEGFVAEVASLPGVEAVSPVGVAPAALPSLRGTGAVLVGVDQSYFDLVRWSLQAGDYDAVRGALLTGGSSCALTMWSAGETGLKTGDVVEVSSMGERFNLQVVGIAQGDPMLGNMAIYVPRNSLAEPCQSRMLLIQRAPGHPGDVLAGRLRELAGRFPGCKMLDLSAQMELIRQQRREMTSILLAVLAAVIGVAVSGIVSTQAMSVVERGRELAAIRAIGGSRALIARIVTLEGGLLGMGGAVLGSTAGLLVGWLATAALAMNDPAAPDFSAPWAMATGWLIACVLLGLAASWLPGGVVTRREPAAALREL